MREAAAHPRSPCWGSKHGQPPPRAAGGRTGPALPPDPARGIQAAAPREDTAELRAVPPAVGILSQAWRRGPHRASIDSTADFTSASHRDRSVGRTSRV
ncbi:unnamed protein product [Coccothraustes coccothraustes]